MKTTRAQLERIACELARHDKLTIIQLSSVIFEFRYANDTSEIHKITRSGYVRGGYTNAISYDSKTIEARLRFQSTPPEGSDTSTLNLHKRG